MVISVLIEKVPVRSGYPDLATGEARRNILSGGVSSWVDTDFKVQYRATSLRRVGDIRLSSGRRSAYVSIVTFSHHYNVCFCIVHHNKEAGPCYLAQHGFVYLPVCLA